jgi:hypothetical protein
LISLSSSWSPDGGYLIYPLGISKNGHGSVIVKRGEWDKVSAFLPGHNAPVSVAVNGQSKSHFAEKKIFFINIESLTSNAFWKR